MEVTDTDRADRVLKNETALRGRIGAEYQELMNGAQLPRHRERQLLHYRWRRCCRGPEERGWPWRLSGSTGSLFPGATARRPLRRRARRFFVLVRDGESAGARVGRGADAAGQGCLP